MGEVLQCKYANTLACAEGCLVADVKDLDTRALVATAGSKLLGVIKETKKDPNTPLTGIEIFQALSRVIDNGNVGDVGFDHFDGHLVAEAAKKAYVNESCVSA